MRKINKSDLSARFGRNQPNLPEIQDLFCILSESDQNRITI